MGELFSFLQYSSRDMYNWGLGLVKLFWLFVGAELTEILFFKLFFVQYIKCI